jgi:uncharacterized protein YciI
MMTDSASIKQPAKKHFVLKYIPHRPTFAGDMTDEEKSVMHRHVAYWTEKLHRGIVLVFGPVLDPKGVYGMGIVEVESEDQVEALIKDDPALIAGLMKTEIAPMQAVLPDRHH